MSFLQEQMHMDAGFKIIRESTCLPGCQEEFAMNVDEDNCFELFSLLFLGHQDFLEYHFDWGTCPHLNFLECAWKTFFVPSLGHMVTGIVTASYKKSCSDYLKQNNDIGRSADKILKIYSDLEEYRRVVTAEMVQPLAPLITLKPSIILFRDTVIPLFIWVLSYIR
jgi:hypothetical protein